MQLPCVTAVLADEPQVGIVRVGAVDEGAQALLLHRAVRTVDRDPRLGGAAQNARTDCSIGLSRSGL